MSTWIVPPGGGGGGDVETEISLSNQNVAENYVGVIATLSVNEAGTWSFALNAGGLGGKVVLSGTNNATLSAQSGGLNYELGAVQDVDITATRASDGKQIRQTRALNVSNVLEITLGALGLTSVFWNTDSVEGSELAEFTGRTPGSTLAVSPNDGRWVIHDNGTLAIIRRGGAAWTEDDHPLTFTETHPDATNSGLETEVTVTVMADAAWTYSAILSDTPIWLKGDTYDGSPPIPNDGALGGSFADGFTGEIVNEAAALNGMTVMRWAADAFATMSLNLTPASGGLLIQWLGKFTQFTHLFHGDNDMAGQGINIRKATNTGTGYNTGDLLIEGNGHNFGSPAGPFISIEDPTWLQDDAWHLVSIYLGPSGQGVWVDGVAQTLKTSTPGSVVSTTAKTSALGAYRFDGTNTMRGRLAEFAMIDTTSEDIRLRGEGYVANRWGVA